MDTGHCDCLRRPWLVRSMEWRTVRTQFLARVSLWWNRIPGALVELSGAGGGARRSLTRSADLRSGGCSGADLGSRYDKYWASIGNALGRCSILSAATPPDPDYICGYRLVHPPRCGADWFESGCCPL